MGGQRRTVVSGKAGSKKCAETKAEGGPEKARARANTLGHSCVSFYIFKGT